MVMDEPQQEDATTMLVDEEEDVFSNRKPKKKAKGSRKPQVAKPIKIVLNSIVAEGFSTKSDVSSSAAPPLTNHQQPELINEFMNFDDLEELDEELEQEIQDSLAFYQETHEDQDPAYAAYQRKLLEEERQHKLAALDLLDQQTRQEIETAFSQLCREKQAATDRTLDKYKQRAVQEEKINTQRYQELYRQKTASNIRKISEGLEILEQRHQKDLRNAMQHHQVQARSRCLNEQMAAAEWHATSKQIQDKHNAQLNAFRNKGDDLKRKTEADYQREQEKIRKQYVQKLQEVDTSRQKLHGKLYQQFHQLRQRYLKRHLQKIMKDKEELLCQGPVVVTTNNAEAMDTYGEGDSKSFSLHTFSNPREFAKSTMEEKAELNPPSPIKSAQPWVEDIRYKSGAASRHQHRKGVMSQTVRQLLLEIHNEGLWLAACPVENDENNKAETTAPSVAEYEFLPWGVKAHQILDAVVCGEIPPGTCERILDKHLNAVEIMSVQAGQVRCIVSDLRTSEETASSHRVVAVQEQEESQVKEFEAKVAEMSKMAVDAENAYTKVVQEEKEQMAAVLAAEEVVKKAMRIQEEFKQKFKSFLGPGKCVFRMISRRMLIFVQCRPYDLEPCNRRQSDSSGKSKRSPGAIESYDALQEQSRFSHTEGQDSETNSQRDQDKSAKATDDC
jgi:hypothetical protein